MPMIPLSIQPSGPRGWPWWRRNTPHNAGDNVNALIAEISIATLIVTANWRNSVPDTPGMNPTGTNTDSSTNEIAITGPVICAIAFFVASCGLRSGFSDITRSTFSTTTIASSTTIPMPSTIASNEIVLRENPNAISTAIEPIKLTGIATIGMIVARQLPRNRNTTSTTRPNAIANVDCTSVRVSATKLLLS